VDAVERSQFCAQHRERVQRAPPCSFGTLFDREVVAEYPRMHELAVVVARELARRARPVAEDDDRVQRVVRWIRPRHRQSELEQTIVDTHNHLSRNAATRAPCHRWPPSNTSCCSASGPPGAASYSGRSRATVSRAAATGKIASSVPDSTSIGRGATRAA